MMLYKIAVAASLLQFPVVGDEVGYKDKYDMYLGALNKLRHGVDVYLVDIVNECVFYEEFNLGEMRYGNYMGLNDVCHAIHHYPGKFRGGGGWHCYVARRCILILGGSTVCLCMKVFEGVVPT